jgi:hypothetical protein
MAAVAALMATSAWAGETSEAQVAKLRAAEKKLAYTEREGRGAHRLLAAQEKRRVESLIERLEAGRMVDPAEVDRAIQRAERGGF